jgi:peptidoglycan/LPS O-acetylase OafA/YrhL
MRAHSNKVIHLPGLNGLRAIAAMGVVVSHITLGLGYFGLNPGLFGKDKEGQPIGLLLAGFGVSIFFALSGFLITYLLLREKEVAPINIRKFYIRRALRIWPLYYLYLIICLLVAWWTSAPYNHTSILFYVFLSANIPFLLGQMVPFVGHYWSLGVEEQFYLFWPWVVKVKNNRLLQLAIGACLGLIGLKLAARIFNIHVGTVNLYDIVHVTRFHCMLIGGIGAMLYYKGYRLFIAFCTNIAVQVISWLVILLVVINKFHTASIIDNEIISCVTVFLILGQVTGRNRIINLNNRVCNFLGKISYGLYVIHPIIIFAFTKIFEGLALPTVPKYLLVYGTIVSVTILVAHASYQLYEKRFLKLKTSFAVVKSSDVKEEPDAVQPATGNEAVVEAGKI